MAGLKLQRFDHVVLTVKDLEVTVDFYTRVLGMRVSASAAIGESMATWMS